MSSTQPDRMREPSSKTARQKLPQYFVCRFDIGTYRAGGGLGRRLTRLSRGGFKAAFVFHELEINAADIDFAAYLDR